MMLGFLNFILPRPAVSLAQPHPVHRAMLEAARQRADNFYRSQSSRHKDLAGRLPTAIGIDARFEDVENRFVRHCQIGKVTRKIAPSSEMNDG